MRRVVKDTKHKSKNQKSETVRGDDVSSDRKITEYFSPSSASAHSEIADSSDRLKELQNTPPVTPVAVNGYGNDKDHDVEDGKVIEKAGKTPTCTSTSTPSPEATPVAARKPKKSRQRYFKVSSKPTSPQIRKPTRHKKPQPESKTTVEGKGESHITDYFPVRKSKRVPQSQLQREIQARIEELILKDCEDGLQVVESCGEKGRGVVATRTILAGQFVVEYAGQLITGKREAKLREEEHASSGAGCYMYYFEHAGLSYCIDATAESGRLGRLINHSIRQANLQSKMFLAGGVPRIIFVAKRDIASREELLYDYGERSRDAIASHPWLVS